ncbi:hypothetical protein [Arthrospiribacter ruber]|nr:hypothetical protein [Arthrospiribacter ruber]
MVNEQKDKIDLEFLESANSFFKNYAVEKKKILDLFTELANAFPIRDQVGRYIHSKGNKISQGYNLDGFPYQVLDIGRNFDIDHGFNIRILHWVGKGMFFFVYLGGEKVNKYLSGIKDSAVESYFYSLKKPFAYPEILVQSLPVKDVKPVDNPGNLMIVWEKIILEREFLKNFDMLLEKIGKAFDYTF